VVVAIVGGQTLIFALRAKDLFSQKLKTTNEQPRTAQTENSNCTALFQRRTLEEQQRNITSAQQQQLQRSLLSPANFSQPSNNNNNSRGLEILTKRTHKIEDFNVQNGYVATSFIIKTSPKYTVIKLAGNA
jgi:hypothetical protein